MLDFKKAYDTVSRPIMCNGAKSTQVACPLFPHLSRPESDLKLTPPDLPYLPAHTSPPFLPSFIASAQSGRQQTPPFLHTCPPSPLPFLSTSPSPSVPPRSLASSGPGPALPSSAARSLASSGSCPEDRSE